MLSSDQGLMTMGVGKTIAMKNVFSTPYSLLSALDLSLYLFASCRLSHTL